MSIYEEKISFFDTSFHFVFPIRVLHGFAEPRPIGRVYAQRTEMNYRAYAQCMDLNHRAY